MATFAFITYGCKVNQYESQALREELLRRQFREVAPEEGADYYIVNTCTVTETAYKEAEKLVRRLGRGNPNARFTITGCAADSNRESFLRLPGVKSVVPHAEKHRLLDLLEVSPDVSDATLRARSKSKDRDIFSLRASRFDGHTRAFLKVEDGCDLCCSFCIIPKVRGGPVSRPIDEAVDEAKRFADNGYREIVLTGVHLGSYGKDLVGRSLISDLVEQILKLPVRVRLSSIEVNEIDRPLIDLMASEPRFCPHLHLPLQSGDDAILRAMRRRYNARQFLAACDQVLERVPDPGFTTDVIIGFPGETTEQFERSVDICRRVGMSRLHLFPYSPRSGTDAARLADDIPWMVKKERLHRLKKIGAGLTQEYGEKFIGREVEVLVETEGGHTERYLKARVGGKPNDLVRARVTRVDRGEVICE